jgi:hypothetical protein
MDATSRFHLRLLGHDRRRTPEEFWLHETYSTLYTAFPNLHGYSSSEPHESLFMATFVLALHQTGTIRPVYIMMPKPKLPWVIDQIERIGRHIFRTRKSDREGALKLREAFRQIRPAQVTLDMPEPDRWLMFGFSSGDILPVWANGKLLDLGELEVPRAGARSPTE